MRSCCCCWVPVVTVAASLALILTACNSTLWPMGCPQYVAADGTVIATTPRAEQYGSQSHYAVLVDWTVCTETIRGQDSDWVTATMEEYPMGRQGLVWLPKPGWGVLGGCFSEREATRTDAFIGFGVGIVFLTLTFLVVAIISCDFFLCRRRVKRAASEAIPDWGEDPTM